MKIAIYDECTRNGGHRAWDQDVCEPSGDVTVIEADRDSLLAARTRAAQLQGGESLYWSRRAHAIEDALRQA